ncbi:MAG: hypothetical protein IT379_21395 [Deltaproteobacteria bacterium]|nr:hypothetical protein [Deltaproteobacteria bacterium]
MARVETAITTAQRAERERALVVAVVPALALALATCGSRPAEDATPSATRADARGAETRPPGGEPPTGPVAPRVVSPTPGGLRFRLPRGRETCRVEGGDQVEVYGYDGAPAECVVPVFVLETGVFGCPTSVALEQRPDDPAEYTYDASGHLTGADEIAYGWEGDRLATVSYTETQPVGVDGRRVWIGDPAAPEMEAELDVQGRPVVIRRFARAALFSETTLTYRGDDLATVRTRFEGGGTRTLTVERCAPPAP